jgi:hypothetical protein
MNDRFPSHLRNGLMTGSFLDAPAPDMPILVDVELCQELLETQRRLALLIAREELDLLLDRTVPAEDRTRAEEGRAP